MDNLFLPGIDPDLPWWLVTRPNDQLMRISDGLTISVRKDMYGYRNKLHISHVRPIGKDGGYVILWVPNVGGKIASPSINVSTTKSLEQVAKDILCAVCCLRLNAFTTSPPCLHYCSPSRV